MGGRGAADVQVGVQELGCRGHRGAPSLQEVGRQQRAGPQPQLFLESRHEEGAVARGEDQRGRGQLGGRRAAGRACQVVLQLEQPGGARGGGERDRVTAALSAELSSKSCRPAGRTRSRGSPPPCLRLELLPMRRAVRD